MKISFFTLGCKVNQYETEAMKNLFFENNWEIVNNSDFADVYVINSCTVTSLSDKKARQSVGRFKKINPNAIIVMTGCFPQAFPQKSQKLKNVDIVTGTTNRSNLPDLIKQFLINKKPIINVSPHKKGEQFENLTIKDFSKKTRAFIKIQDGCNKYCSYCIIPKSRGFVRSKPLETLKNELISVAESGYKEVVLVGINLSSYGADLKDTGLTDAVKTAAKIPKIKRIRLGSIEPDLLTTDDILKLSKEDKFCQQFHLALQSGSDSVLKRMRRRYTKDLYKNLVEYILQTFENPSITTDIMVGFPGETEEEFNESLKLIEDINFLKVHIFPYSIRQGTQAAKMENQITKSEKQLRVKKMELASKKSNQAFMSKQINKIHEVLFETQEGDVFTGHAKNYVLVKAKSDLNLCGQIKYVKINGYEENFCIGELI